MPPRHELPTHLAVQDRVLAGLSMRQFLLLLLGAAGAYDAWSGPPALRPAVRAGLAVSSLLVALAVALLRPGGRDLEAWGLAILRFLAVPKVSVWSARRSAAPVPGDDGHHWVAYAHPLAWATGPERAGR